MSDTLSRGPLQPGDRAPNVVLEAITRDGRIAIDDFRGRKPLLIGLFRGLHCPFCRRHLAAQAEIDKVLSQRLPTFADVPKLVYTRAVVDETLRLYPPLPFLSREVVRDETFRDIAIPKGSLLFVVPWLLHRHRKLWHEPDHFIPKRFLPGSTPPSKFAYIPFSIGPRVCTGMAFGEIEAILCLATQKYLVKGVA